VFDKTSRYAQIETTTLKVTDADGTEREVRYVRRRFLPEADKLTTLVEHTVTEGDRLDNVAAKYLGDPVLFWHIADANNAMRPEELTEEVGRALKIAMPGF
jgi:nucleoid-associated protein YgaU